VQRQALAAAEAAAGGKGADQPRPFVTYDADYVVQSGDVQAGVEHVGRGRSGADSIVFFADLRVIAVGDLFTHGTPQPDCASGGSFAGWAAALTHVLFFDFDVAVPSRGAPVGRQALVDFRARLQALAERDRCLFQYGSTE
jgi:hypothetical protein